MTETRHEERGWVSRLWWWRLGRYQGNGDWKGPVPNGGTSIGLLTLMAWYDPLLTFCALSTSEKVPSPFFDTSRYLRIDV